MITTLTFGFGGKARSKWVPGIIGIIAVKTS
jgi:hypothetical protein